MSSQHRPVLFMLVLSLCLLSPTATAARLFDARMDFRVGDDPRSAAMGDLDGDGIFDVVTANFASDDISVMLGNGDGIFQIAMNTYVGHHPTAVVLADLDGNGNLDLAVVLEFGNTVMVGLGTGDGSFPSSEYYPVGGDPDSIAVGDLNGDGTPDLVTANSAVDTVTVLINRKGPTEKTISATLTCSPSSGTLPFTTQMSVTLRNHYSGQTRRVTARINITLANGTAVFNWRRGYANITAGSIYTTNWNQNIPLALSLVGNNLFTLEAEDVTPAPFNQPPYPPSGDTDVVAKVVTGIKP